MKLKKDFYILNVPYFIQKVNVFAPSPPPNQGVKGVQHYLGTLFVCLGEGSLSILYKWGYSETAKPILKVLLVSWAVSILTVGFKSFQG